MSGTVNQRHWCANVSFQRARAQARRSQPVFRGQSIRERIWLWALPHPPSITVSSCFRIISLASKFHFQIWSSKVRPLVPVPVRHMKLRAVRRQASFFAQRGCTHRPANSSASRKSPSADRSSRRSLRRSRRLPVAVSSMDRSLILVVAKKSGAYRLRETPLMAGRKGDRSLTKAVPL